MSDWSSVQMRPSLSQSTETAAAAAAAELVAMCCYAMDAERTLNATVYRYMYL